MAVAGVREDLLASISAEVAPAVIEFTFVQNGQASVWPAAGGDLFAIGSITKTFTALLLADMVETCRVALSDPIGTYVPEAAACADVTLYELATHTSGLPQLPDPLPARGAQCPHDPYSAVTAEDMLQAAKGALPGPQRGEFEYSNFGYALLAVALSAVAGASFESLVCARVLDRLGLDDTIFNVHDDPRLVDGHDLGGATVPPLAQRGHGRLRRSSLHQRRSRPVSRGPARSERNAARLRHKSDSAASPTARRSPVHSAGLGHRRGRKWSALLA